jgi:hypothetical protein
MKFNLNSILLDKHILLAIEKTVNSNQNIELKNYAMLADIKKLTLGIAQSNHKKRQEKIKKVVNTVRGRINLFFSDDSNAKIELVSYLRPKNFNIDKENRDQIEDYRELKIHKDIFDEIALNTITLVFTDSLRTLIPDSNYGNNLDDFDSRNFFKPYFSQYKEFSGKRFEYLSKNMFNYLSTFDIKKFYDRVDFKKIEEIIYDHYDKTDLCVQRTIKIYKSLCSSGLPQGPIFSHFFASLLLSDLKEKFKMRFPTFEIIHYVDDINVFFNSTNSDNAEKIDSDIYDFLINYLKPKFIVNESLEILNEQKHQIIRITENNYLSNIMLQLSALDELRKDDSKRLDAFDRRALSEDLETLFEEMFIEFQRIATIEGKDNSNVFDNHEHGNIIEKTARFRTYRQLLLVNNLKELRSSIMELVENDIKRQTLGLSYKDNVSFGSLFDKSFENYIRAIISIMDNFGSDLTKIAKLINELVIDKVKTVFKNSGNQDGYYKTFKTICNNTLYEYKHYKYVKDLRKSQFQHNSYIEKYDIDKLLKNLLSVKEQAFKTSSESVKALDNIYINKYLKINSLTFEIEVIDIEGISLYREDSIIEQLHDYFMMLFKYDPSDIKGITVYNKNKGLLKVCEFRILSLYNGYTATPLDIIDKSIEIINQTIIADDNELCDPLIHDTIDIVSKKIKDRITIDSIIIAHHFVRDLWKNGARDLPFYTLHNHEHSVELIRLLNRINLKSNGIIVNHLNNYEYYTLIMSIYLHDLGMLFFDYDSLRNGSSDKSSRKFEIKQFDFYTNDLSNFKTRYNRNEKIEKIIQSFKNHRDYRAEYTRSQHHYNTSRFEEIEKMVIDNLGSFVKDICYNHGVSKAEMKLTDTYRNKTKIEANKVSIYLRFLDGLDNCKNRVSKSLYKTILNYVTNDDVEKYTITHWAKHLLIDEIDYSRMESTVEYINDTGVKLPTNVKKVLNIKLCINEKINTTMQSSVPKEGVLDIIDLSDEFGYIIKGYKKDKKTIFEKFINEYFYWTYMGILDMSTLLESRYGVMLSFSYKIGSRKMDYSNIIFDYLQ